MAEPATKARRISPPESAGMTIWISTGDGAVEVPRFSKKHIAVPEGAFTGRVQKKALDDIEKTMDELEKSMVRRVLEWRQRDLVPRLRALRTLVRTYKYRAEEELDHEGFAVRGPIEVLEATVRNLQWVWTGDIIDSDSEGNDCDVEKAASVKDEPCDDGDVEEEEVESEGD